jgi:hypothetical protein
MQRQELYEILEDYPEEVKKDFAERNAMIKERGYYDPLEDIYEKIEEIVNNPDFGILYNVDSNLHECTSCGRTKEFLFPILIEEYEEALINFPHYEICYIEKLRSLIATLGDMIS